MTFAELDLARIRNATEDNAHRYYGGPLSLGKDDAARYVAEGHLKQYPLAETWREVAALLDARPEILTLTAAEVEQRRTNRANLCEEYAHNAHRHLVTGWVDDAHGLIDDGELLDPDHRVLGRYSWQQIRDAVIAEAAKVSS